MTLIPASAPLRQSARTWLACLMALLAAMAATAQTRPTASAPESLQVAPGSPLHAQEAEAPQAPRSAQPPASASPSTSNGLRLAPGSHHPQSPQAAPLPAPAAPEAEAIARALTGTEPLRPPRSIARTGYWQANGHWLIPLLVVVVLAAAATGIALYRRSRRPVVVSPQLLAVQAIENAATHSEDRLFASAVSDAVRGYLEARFQLRAPEQTTEEFLQDAPRSSHLPPPAVEALAHLLSLCDLAKFARQGLSPVQRSELSETALKLVWSLGQPDGLAEAQPTADAQGAAPPPAQQAG